MQNRGIYHPHIYSSCILSAKLHTHHARFPKILVDNVSHLWEDSRVNEIFFLGPALEIIETVLFTGQITGEIPTSIMLVGPSGSAK